ncbi:sodium:proton antiporter [Herbaspirillum sp. RTI4]|uniref:sodium:proton antiporter n=1 Tax=Herbaspirillum sp. RTI4 TaxID=3048640 RepID=UPI002AB39995|nr:sodium:proton antiporter [Herbaspirillum sp. RTI4]MDY7579714.1 sodium:proton antiporter [Herbaspirillum sp. RTI4]MEA9983041.1 sodium:proton antiporter [Herbaspirillum sp. RTI4]
MLPGLCLAAELDGTQLSPAWAVPFIGMLLSIALWPLLAPVFWHRHFGKIAAAWSLSLLLPFAVQFGIMPAAAGAVHAMVAEYIPFIALLTALYVVAGGICVRGDLRGTPALNTCILGLGTFLASLMGTTGASMLLIRPLLRANGNRREAAHVVVFFIFLVANAGGALTPLGDPPLFLGFLKGVDFFWTMRHIFPHTLFVCLSLLAVFYLIERYYYLPRESLRRAVVVSDDFVAPRLSFDGSMNFILLVAVVGLVLMSGLWKPGISFSLLGTPVELQNLVRDGFLFVVVFLSLWMTPKTARKDNDFTWGPIAEVAKLFAAIFLTIIPVIAMLRAGEQGAFSSVVKAVTGPDGQPVDLMYFWVTGILSSFLDNAPTYLVFFNTASGDAATLMTTLASTLAAISAGAVFMGAMTYIGNAPNLMVKSIAEAHGVRMPSFFGYMGWSCTILLPIFIVMSFLFIL